MLYLVIGCGFCSCCEKLKNVSKTLAKHTKIENPSRPNHPGISSYCISFVGDEIVVKNALSAGFFGCSIFLTIASEVFSESGHQK